MTCHLRYRESIINIESDIQAKHPAYEALIEFYREIEAYIHKNPLFASSYSPLKEDPQAPEIVSEMLSASKKMQVGPMASVAGAASLYVAQKLESEGAQKIVVENGGDIYVKLTESQKIRLHAGPSPLSDKLAFEIQPKQTPLGVCTSAGSVGHSISLGQADAVAVFAKNVVLADAAATAFANKADEKRNYSQILDATKANPDLDGVLIVIGDELCCFGKLPEITQI